MNDDLTLKEAFEIILSIENVDESFIEMTELIYQKGLKVTKQDTLKVIINNKFKSYSDFKENALEIIIRYIRLTLKDNYLTQQEKRNVKFLKLIFNIKEGDFYDESVYIYEEIEEIIQTQLHLIYIDDNKIDSDEALHKVDLQELFDLSYDQFLEFANIEDKKAIQRGASLKDLDTVFYNKYKNEDSTPSREISQNVKDKVWNRDDGVCTQCGENKNLEFDHIIPFSKGGANTYRNIQLLCQPCNRSKSDHIG
jgi:5-methylcytosine-specific restriction endonuclease McrA